MTTFPRLKKPAFRFSKKLSTEEWLTQYRRVLEALIEHFDHFDFLEAKEMVEMYVDALRKAELKNLLRDAQ